MNNSNNIIDLGSITVPEKWEDVTLHQYERLQEYIESVKSEGDEDLPLNKYEVLSVFIDKSIDEIYVMPIEIVNILMSKLQFMQSAPDVIEDNLYITENGEEYFINYMEQLKVKEYEDIDTILKSNPHNLSAILAILCRRKTGEKIDPLTNHKTLQSEPYDSYFANEIFDKRLEFWQQQPLTKVLPLIAFFLHRNAVLTTLSDDYMKKIVQEANDYVMHTKTLLKRMGFRKWFMIPQMIKLKKLEKSLKSI